MRTKLQLILGGKKFVLQQSFDQQFPVKSLDTLLVRFFNKLSDQKVLIHFLFLFFLYLCADLSCSFKARHF